MKLAQTANPSGKIVNASTSRMDGPTSSQRMFRSIHEEAARDRLLTVVVSAPVATLRRQAVILTAWPFFATVFWLVAPGSFRNAAYDAFCFATPSLLVMLSHSLAVSFSADWMSLPA